MAVFPMTNTGPITEWDSVDIYLLNNGTNRGGDVSNLKKMVARDRPASLAKICSENLHPFTLVFRFYG